MTLGRIVQAVRIACLLSGCMSSYEDVSAEPSYRSLIGLQIRSSETLLHEVTLDRDYAQRVDVCTITLAVRGRGTAFVHRLTNDEAA